MGVLPSYTGTGPIDCSGENFNKYPDTQNHETCHVCLSVDAMIGLTVSGC